MIGRCDLAAILLWGKEEQKVGEEEVEDSGDEESKMNANGSGID